MPGFRAHSRNLTQLIKSLFPPEGRESMNGVVAPYLSDTIVLTNPALGGMRQFGYGVTISSGTAGATSVGSGAATGPQGDNTVRLVTAFHATHNDVATRLISISVARAGATAIVASASVASGVPVVAPRTLILVPGDFLFANADAMGGAAQLTINHMGLDLPDGAFGAMIP